MSKKFENCPYLFKVRINGEEIFLFAETEDDAFIKAMDEFEGEFSSSTTETICFANDILNINELKQ